MSKTRIENFIGLSFDFVDVPNCEMPVLNRGPLQAGEITMSQYRSNNIGAKYLLIKQTHVNSRLLAPSPPFLWSLFPPVLNQAFHIFYSIDRDQWRMQDWGGSSQGRCDTEMKILSVFRIRVPTFLHLDPDPGGKGAKNTGKI